MAAAARAEVEDSLGPDRISRIVVDSGGRVLGWIGGQPQYNGNVWELHPLVVRGGCRRRGVGLSPTCWRGWGRSVICAPTRTSSI
ncbi:MAG: GNAT family N-acetyltransferase [Spirochaetes bacterium]|nr:GNAT family N-acetyltransferase [Spirochaetota bacterium]